MLLVLIGLLTAIYFDFGVFKQRNHVLASEVFAFSKRWVSVFIVLAVVCLFKDMGEEVSVGLLLLFLLRYLVGRYRFYQIVKVKNLVHERKKVLLSDALGFFIVWIYSVLVFELFFSAVEPWIPALGSEMAGLIVSTAFSSVLSFVLIYIFSVRISQQGFLVNVAVHKGYQSWKKIILVSVSLGLFFAYFAASLLVTRQIQPETPLGDILETTQSFGLIFIFIFLAICVAPFIEEIVFRGYFFRVIKEVKGQKWAFYSIALTFAFLHVGQYWGDWMTIIMVTILGFVLTLLRVWTGSAAASVIMHYVYNAGVTIFPIIIIAVTNPAYFSYQAQYAHLDFTTKESLLQESIQKQPQWVDAYNELAGLYVQEDKNLREALYLIDRALKFAPENKTYLSTKHEVVVRLNSQLRISKDGVTNLINYGILSEKYQNLNR